MNETLTARWNEFVAATPPVWLSAIDLLLKATVLLVAGLLFDTLLRRRRPLACATMWNAVLAALVMLPAAQWLLPKTELLARFLPAGAAELTPRENASEMAAPANRENASAGAPPVNLTPRMNVVPQAVAPVLVAPVEPIMDQPAAAAPVVAPPASPPNRIALRQILLIIAGVYLFGLLAAIWRTAAALRAVAKLRRSSAPLEDDDWQHRFTRWLKKLGLARRVGLRSSEAVAVPLAVGWRRPLVVVPQEVVAKAKPESRDAVLVHELTHVARGDCFWQLVLRGLQTVLWFHPLVWLIERRIHFVRERVCDAFSVHGLGSAEQYADALLEMAGRMTKRCKLSLGLAVARSSKLGERLTAIHECGGDGRYRASRLGRALAGVLAVGAALLLGHGAVAQVSVTPVAGLPDEAAAVVESYEAAFHSVRRLADTQLQARREQTIARLQALQDEYTRAAKLDEAVAIRDQIRALRAMPIAVAPVVTTQEITQPLHSYTGWTQIPSPTVIQKIEEMQSGGDLSEYASRLGEIFYFRVRGELAAGVWGTDYYSHDSTLASAAVHAGILQDGEEAILQVTMLKGPRHFLGSTRNQVTSGDWDNSDGGYNAYRIEKLSPGTGTLQVKSGAFTTSSTLYINSAPGMPGTGPTEWNPVPAVSPDPDLLLNFRGRIGQSFYYRVTGDSGEIRSIWGTDVYTDDSHLAKAAVHAGVLQGGETGVVKVTILPGRETYQGGTRNGVTSLNYGSFPGSYRVERDDRRAAVAAPTPVDTATIWIDVPSDVNLYNQPGSVGTVRYYTVRGSTQGFVWGTDLYTRDSSVATAAVHAGILKPGQTGSVKVTMLEGAASYQGSTRNGVTSSDYGAWDGSFRVEADDRRSDASQPAATPQFKTTVLDEQNLANEQAEAAQQAAVEAVAVAEARAEAAQAEAARAEALAARAHAVVREIDSTTFQKLSAGPNAPKIDGTVRTVSSDGLIEVALVAAHGLKAGQALEVWRARSDGTVATYLGRIEIVQTQEQSAVCKVLTRSGQVTIERGDHVTTKLN